MRSTLAAVVVLALSATAMAQFQDVTVNGAGASFPFPIYSQWANAYNKLTGLKVNYQSIGSGGGIAQIKAGTVDFGASDAPLKADELEKAGLVQFPMIIGGVVPVVNMEGVKPGQLKLTGELLADIYMGKVKKWNDEAVKKLNSGVKLPDQDISVVARSDGSGTTWIYTTYLAAVSKEWKEKLGANKTIQWPVGSAGKGNEGVAAMVKQLPNSIGYVEYAYAQQEKMTYTQIVNKAGKAVEPTIKSFVAAAASADWKNAPGYYVVLVDQPGDESWPIAGASFVLVHKEIKNAQTARAMFAFFDWAFEHGKQMAEKLDYVPVPKNVVELVQKTWAKDVTTDGKPVWSAEKADKK
jgi:phosphate transport system substrate-binding protein